MAALPDDDICLVCAAVVLKNRTKSSLVVLDVQNELLTQLRTMVHAADSPCLWLIDFMVKGTTILKALIVKVYLTNGPSSCLEARSMILRHVCTGKEPLMAVLATWK